MVVFKTSENISETVREGGGGEGEEPSFVSAH